MAAGGSVHLGCAGRLGSLCSLQQQPHMPARACPACLWGHPRLPAAVEPLCCGGRLWGCHPQRHGPWRQARTAAVRSALAIWQFLEVVACCYLHPKTRALCSHDCRPWLQCQARSAAALVLSAADPDPTSGCSVSMKPAGQMVASCCMGVPHGFCVPPNIFKEGAVLEQPHRHAHPLMGARPQQQTLPMRKPSPDTAGATCAAAAPPAELCC